MQSPLKSMNAFEFGIEMKSVLSCCLQLESSSGVITKSAKFAIVKIPGSFEAAIKSGLPRAT